MSVANVEKTRCYETISELYLYDACKAQTLLYCVCVVAAKLIHFCIAFASLPQSPNTFVLRLRRCCKAQTFLYCICVVAAKLKHFCIAFASLPQSPNTFVLHLRRCRNPQTGFEFDFYKIRFTRLHIKRCAKFGDITLKLE